MNRLGHPDVGAVERFLDQSKRFASGFQMIVSSLIDPARAPERNAAVTEFLDTARRWRVVQHTLGLPERRDRQVLRREQVGCCIDTDFKSKRRSGFSV